MLKPSTVVQKINEVGKPWYTVTNEDGTQVAVPQDEYNTDYQTLQTWIANGGVVTQQ